jgi:hypothetical protein
MKLKPEDCTARASFACFMTPMEAIKVILTDW